MFSAISQQSQFLLRLLFFLRHHCEFTDTNIIGVDALQGSNFYKKQTLLQHPTDQVPYITRCKATKAKSKKFMQQTINVHLIVVLKNMTWSN